MLSMRRTESDLTVGDADSVGVIRGRGAVEAGGIHDGGRRRVGPVGGGVERRRG